MKMDRIAKIIGSGVLLLAFLPGPGGMNCRGSAMLELSFEHLADLGDRAGHYEGWIVIDAEAFSTGKFVIDEEGNVTSPDRRETYGTVESALFPIDPMLLDGEKVVVTVEPQGDRDPAPSAQKLLIGTIVEGEAMLSTREGVGDFRTSMGSYILATPSDNDSNPMMNDDMGIWWLMPMSGEASLDLPELSEGWIYEGWIVDISGRDPIPYSTGTFRDPAGPDSTKAGPYAGPDNDGPPFPGEDYVSGMPLDLNSGAFAAVISVEPVPDNSPMPFQLKPLLAEIPRNAHTAPTMHMMQNLSHELPTGMARLSD